MSVSSIGGDALQQRQSLIESRTNQSADSSAATRLRPPRGPPPGASASTAAGPADASGNPTGAGSVSSASAKVISDLKALFIDLQAGANTAGAASATVASAGADTIAGTGSPTSVQSASQTLPGNSAKVSGHHGGHHLHRPTSAGPSSTGLTAGTPAGTTATAGQSAPKRSGGLLDELVGALKAYAASSTGSSAKTTSSLTA